MSKMDYSKYQHLRVSKKDGVALITINRPEHMNAVNEKLHTELTTIWHDVDEDPEVKVSVITGAGKAFSAGGDYSLIETVLGPDKGKAIVHMFETAKQLVHSLVDSQKPIISAINGVAVGAGLVVALMADISIASENARFNDGHIRLGVSAGDHACGIWPLLCGMAKAKYFLLTGAWIDAKEAERIGLVSMVVPQDSVLSEAMKVANVLSQGPQPAIKFTKNALNQWLRLGNLTSFDYSCALEVLTFALQEDVKEGKAALKDKRKPAFPSARL